MMYTADDMRMVFWVAYIGGLMVGGVVVPLTVKLIKRIWR